MMILRGASTVLILALTLHADVKPTRMLVAADGAVCYVDFTNAARTPAAAWVAVYDADYAEVLPKPRSDSVQTALVSKDVVVARDHVPTTIGQGEFYAVLRFDDWLSRHAPEGSVLKLVDAPPFRPGTKSHKIDLVDKPLAASNQMVVYTTAMGATTPDTIFRRELLVAEGRIVGRGGGSCAIPAGGFVVSGHLMSALWLSRWGMIGARVTRLPGTVTVETDAETWFRHARYYLDLVARRPIGTAVHARDTRRRQWARLGADLAQARQDAAGRPEESWTTVCNVIRDSKNMLYASVESPASELRGVWMPGLLDGPYLERFVRRMREAGVNAVGPQVLDWSDDGIGRLNAMARRLRADGIKTFAWTWLPAQTLVPVEAVLAEHPDWEDHSRSKALARLDLANAEALAWACRSVTRACRKAEIDGILFDYEGYHGGYSQASRAAFIAREELPDSFDPAALGGDDRESAAKWRQWRRDLLAEATTRLAAAARDGRPGITVVASCNAPDYSPGFYGDEALHMVWPDFLKDGAFDAVSPMAYAQDARWVARSCAKAAGIVGDRAALTPSLILYPETGGSAPIEPELLIDQVEGVRAAGASGVWLFMGVQLMPHQGAAGDDLYDCLRQGLFRSTARN